ncbi:Crp/Fnr family transcriptional regulator [Stenomitos frigidus]|uniref:Crp/Fnr family transcriptional regulator n=1 Tax=Stenomitos frigidus ULC18 TaxID=2107698 RepID=A0A2T1ENN1_9CYAN|nr:Crp/Fnr family transcriptional regulator [Stenomitos frigidus]PSB34357.1 Crp/Fnr family transcriptional regulator [Stenomitos frigidus ULC18]
MPASRPSALPENRLLAALPPADHQRLQPHLELMTLPLKQSIYEAGDPITEVYFPRSAIVSLVANLEDGSTMEAGMVGQEGMAGIPALLGGMTKAHRAFVQVAGEAWRLKTTVLQEEFDRGDALQKLLLRYFQALFTQVAQVGVCNRFHNIEERLARWLLLVSDCMQSETFPLTQEFIAQMIGVRRAGVTVAAGILSQAGLIRYSRGQITITDRPSLEAFSCECHKVVRDEFAWLYDSTVQ